MRPRRSTRVRRVPFFAPVTWTCSTLPRAFTAAAAAAVVEANATDASSATSARVRFMRPTLSGGAQADGRLVSDSGQR